MPTAECFLIETEFDIETFTTYVLLEKCLNVGSLAADMIDFVNLVYGKTWATCGYGF